MRWTTALAIYFVIWWTVLFAVLPWGVRTQPEEDRIPGTDPGAPVAPALWSKALWTTIAAAVLFGLFYVAYVTRVVSLDELARWLHVDR
jgi:predicted secreted protein